jgi:hypothetical protein
MMPENNSEYIYWVETDPGFGDKKELFVPVPRSGWKKGGKLVNCGDVIVGKVYFRPAGSSPLVVTNSKWSCFGKYIVQYLDKNVANTCNAKQLVEAIRETEEESQMEKTLYQVIGTETYATHLATNSAGKYVLEVKGTGEVITKDKSEIEEVVPYTVGIRFDSSTIYSYFAKEGQFKVGDLLLAKGDELGNLAKVASIDTKSKKATKYFEGVKLVTEVINNG